jgi:hypothetical protein
MWSELLGNIARRAEIDYATPAAIVLLACVILTVFIPESSGPDSACQKRPDTTSALDLTDPHQDEHLSHDAEEAEDIAIRYADGHSRPGTGAGHTMTEYEQTRDQCMAALFQTIADHHHVTQQKVRESIDKYRHTSADVAAMLSFGFLYGLFVNYIVRQIWRRFPPKQDRVIGILATVAISLVVSLIGVILGEPWTFRAEALRIGYGHLSYRDARIPWTQHRPELFAAGLAIFWILSLVRYQRPERDSDSRLALLR